MSDVIQKAKNSIHERAELPGMSLMEHLSELRLRLIHSFIALAIGFIIAYAFHKQLYGIVQAPLLKLHLKLSFTNPTDPMNLYIKTALVGGVILASPYITYQLWMFVSPGMYANERKYVLPFVSSAVALFLAGAWFGYRYVLVGTIQVLVIDMGKDFNSLLTIHDYTGFFMSIILGLGISFELPILVLFLALLGIVDAKFLVRHIRYAILIIFVIAAVICPSPEPTAMCLFALPMLALYLISIVVAFFVHPSRRKRNLAVVMAFWVAASAMRRIQRESHA
jgi:sec-independent protein translocase protein TatC